jgi:hypothetical protein
MKPMTPTVRQGGEPDQRHGKPEASRVIVVQRQQGERAHQQRGGKHAESQPRREKARGHPVLLAQRAAAPDEQAGEIMAVEQREHRGQRAAIQAHHHAGQHHGERREPPVPGQAEHDERGDQPARHRRPFAPERQHRGCP